MAVLLVDLENVNSSDGLRGVEYLSEGDTLYIFYSGCCGKMRTDQTDAIERSGCTFKSYKLRASGKNALDFYIATECGILYEQGIRRIAIISKDKGFRAVRDYFLVRGGGMQVFTAPNIEQALAADSEPGDVERRRMIQSRMEPVDIKVMQTRMEERRAFREKLQEALEREGFGDMYEHVLAYFEGNHKYPPKQIYTGTLHEFGRDTGCRIYRILKAVS